jgi:hypothetical protein
MHIFVSLSLQAQEYLRYTTLESSVVSTGQRLKCTFIFEKIAHLGTTGENELSHVFDDFRLLFGRECSEPFGKTHFALS